MPEIHIIAFETEADWTAWLAKNHADSAGVWVKIAKKDSGQTTISYQQALDVALCYGWIDGQKNKFDDQYFLQKFTPRRARSLWSRINRDKVEALIAAGRMQEPGLREVERAKADGRWEQAYESQRTMSVPEDFQAALDEHPEAQAFFNTLNSVNRYAILYRITTAMKAETRQNRIRKYIDMLNAHETIHN